MNNNLSGRMKKSLVLLVLLACNCLAQEQLKPSEQRQPNEAQASVGQLGPATVELLSQRLQLAQIKIDELQALINQLHADLLALSAPRQIEQQQQQQPSPLPHPLENEAGQAGEISQPAASSPTEQPPPQAPEDGAHGPEAPVPEIKSPEADVPGSEIQVPAAQVPEVPAPGGQASEVKSPEISVPDVQPPEVVAPGSEAPEAAVPEERGSESDLQVATTTKQVDQQVAPAEGAQQANLDGAEQEALLKRRNWVQRMGDRRKERQAKKKKKNKDKSKPSSAREGQSSEPHRYEPSSEDDKAKLQGDASSINIKPPPFSDNKIPNPPSFSSWMPAKNHLPENYDSSNQEFPQQQHEQHRQHQSQGRPQQQHHHQPHQQQQQQQQNHHHQPQQQHHQAQQQNHHQQQQQQQHQHQNQHEQYHQTQHQPQQHYQPQQQQQQQPNQHHHQHEPPAQEYQHQAHQSMHQFEHGRDANSHGGHNFESEHGRGGAHNSGQQHESGAEEKPSGKLAGFADSIRNIAQEQVSKLPLPQAFRHDQSSASHENQPTAHASHSMPPTQPHHAPSAAAAAAVHHGGQFDQQHSSGPHQATSKPESFFQNFAPGSSHAHGTNHGNQQQANFYNGDRGHHQQQQQHNSGGRFSRLRPRTGLFGRRDQHQHQQHHQQQHYQQHQHQHESSFVVDSRSHNVRDFVHDTIAKVKRRMVRPMRALRRQAHDVNGLFQYQASEMRDRLARGGKSMRQQMKRMRHSSATGAHGLVHSNRQDGGVMRAGQQLHEEEEEDFQDALSSGELDWDDDDDDEDAEFDEAFDGQFGGEGAPAQGERTIMMPYYRSVPDRLGKLPNVP